MSKPVKVYNKGTRPVVFKRDRTGVDAIHPGKFLTFNAKIAAAVINKFEDACSEEDYKKHLVEVIKEIEASNKKKEEAREKHLEEVAKKKADDKKKAEIEAKKKAEAEKGK